MRTVTFKKVNAAAWYAMGVDPDTADLSAAQKERMAGHLERRLREAIEKDWWPELTILEERDVTSGMVDPDETDCTPIGEVQAVFQADPRETKNVYQMAFWLDPDGIVVGSDAPDSVFVSFRGRPELLTTTAYAAGTAYVVGNYVYYDTTGEVYRCIKDGTGKTPGTETTYWVKVDMPWIFKDWLRLAAAADELAFQRDYEKGKELLGDAYMELERVHSVAFAQQGQVGSATVRVC
jgi:hypothetical protein